MQLKLIIALCGFSAAFLTNEEVGVISSSLKRLKIGKCILSLQVDLNVVKNLNENYVITGYVPPERLESYVTGPPDGTVAVVTKDKNHVKTLFQKGDENLQWFTWFLFTEDDLCDVDIPFNCQFFQVKKERNGTYRVIERYKLKKVFVREDFGLWSTGEDLNSTSLSMYQRRGDFRGTTMKIKLCKKYRGYMSILEFFEDAGRLLNFTIEKELKHANTDITPGSIPMGDADASTCTWAVTGLEKEKEWMFLYFNINTPPENGPGRGGTVLKNRKPENSSYAKAPKPESATSRPHRVAETKMFEKIYLGYPCTFRVGAVTKFRGSNDVGWRAYLTPFANDMWLAVLAWLSISTTVTILLRGCRKDAVFTNVFTPFFCLCNIDPMVTHPPSEPLSFSTQLVYLMLLTVPSILIPAYSGYILSTLSCVLPLTPFVDLKSFRKDGSFTLTAPDSSFALRLINQTKDPDLKYIFENMFRRTSKSFEEQFEKLCKDNKLVGLFPNAKTMYNLFKCKMYVMPGTVVAISTALLLPNGSPYRRFMNKWFRKHSEKGLKYHESRTVFVENDFQGNIESLNSLNMSQMKAIFFLLFIGAALSVIALIIEIAVARRNQNLRIRTPLP